jgi:hypothetical protein
VLQDVVFPTVEQDTRERVTGMVMYVGSWVSQSRAAS